MKYELAKKLKDAGFPQYPEDDGCPGKALFWRREYVRDLEIGDNKFYIPTLEELIEACGDDLNSITRTKKGTWVALSYKLPPLDPESIIYGKTPEEAVANLWLRLLTK